MFFQNSLAFPMIQWMLAIWSLVPLPFLFFFYCWEIIFFYFYYFFFLNILGQFWGRNSLSILELKVNSWLGKVAVGNNNFFFFTISVRMGHKDFFFENLYCKLAPKSFYKLKLRKWASASSETWQLMSLGLVLKIMLEIIIMFVEKEVRRQEVWHREKLPLFMVTWRLERQAWEMESRY